MSTPQMCLPEQNYTPDVSTPQQSTTTSTTPTVSQPQGNQAACANLPTAQLSLSNLGQISVPVVVPGAVVSTSLSLGGQLTAREKCSQNPATVSNTGVNVSGGGAQAGTDTDGNDTVQLSSTLAGITSSVQVNLNSGMPQVTIGSVGTFGSTQTSVETLPTGAVKTTYQCTSRDVRVERNGIEITGNISYTLEVIIQPMPRAPWYQRALDWVSEGARSLADWIADHRQEILVGVGVVALVVVAAIVIAGTGGAAAPALALGS